MRLDRYICKSTRFSRDEAARLIRAGDVTVAGKSDLHEAFQVHAHQDIRLLGKPLTPRPSRYIMFHKPTGCVSSHRDGRYPSLFQYLEEFDVDNLHLAGRLDRDTTGLVLITDDGRWSFNIISPDADCRKTYRVGLKKPIAPSAIAALETGVMLPGTTQTTRPAQVEVITECEVNITITEGKYHQVKRMFSAVNNKVVTLHRQQIGPLKLDIAEGQWRHLSPIEVSYFAPPATDLR